MSPKVVWRTAEGASLDSPTFSCNQHPSLAILGEEAEGGGDVDGGDDVLLGWLLVEDVPVIRLPVVIRVLGAERLLVREQVEPQVSSVIPLS